MSKQVIKSASMLTPSHIRFGRLMAAATPPSVQRVKCLQAFTLIRYSANRAEQRIDVFFFNRSAASPLRMGDAAVPGICCPVVLFCVLLRQSLDTLLHRSVKSGLQAAGSDIVH